MDLLKVQRFPYQKRRHNKGNFTLPTEVLKSYSPDLFNRSCVTQSKSKKNGNLEPKSELITFFFFKVTLKATGFNSGS